MLLNAHKMLFVTKYQKEPHSFQQLKLKLTVRKVEMTVYRKSIFLGLWMGFFQSQKNWNFRLAQSN